MMKSIQVCKVSVVFLLGISGILSACGEDLGMEELEIDSASSSIVTRVTLGINQSLRAGQFLEVGRGDRDRHARLIVQGDGNVVVRRERDDRVVWDTKTAGNGGGARLTMQDDCNLVLYNSAGRPLWESFTGGEGRDCRFDFYQNQGVDSRPSFFNQVVGQVRRGDVRVKTIFNRSLLGR